jgi:hypothetical protein
MFAASPTVGGGTIYVKSTSMDNPSFADQPGLGRPFINSPTNANLNNATTTKQSLNGTTDLVVLATDEVTHKYMHNVIDLAGQAPPPVDTTPPTVTSTTPAANATGVQVGASVSAIFSEAVNGVSTSSFTLTPQGGSALTATVTYDSANKTAALDPNADLLPNTTYTAQLTSDITDLAGNVLVPLSWSFTTAAGSTTVNFGADADTYVSQSSPTSNYATNNQLQVVGGSSSAKQAFLRFTVSSLPVGATISSAKLRLYVTNDSTSGGVFNRITSTNWAENSTWNTKPAIDGPQLATLGAVAVNTFYEVDVTTAISGNSTFFTVCRFSCRYNMLFAHRRLWGA